MTEQNFSIATHTFRCDKGHEMESYGEFFMSIMDTKGAIKQYCYCPYCFGEWLEAQWPFKKV